MRAGVIGAVLIAAMGVALSGCISADVATQLPDAADQVDGAWSSFQVDAKNCHEAGGVSVYNMANGRVPIVGGMSMGNGPTPDFEYADISDEVGNPLVASYGVPRVGPAYGIWHITVVCETYNFDGSVKETLKWGWVGMKVKPPRWDDGKIQRQFIVADLSFADPAIVKDLSDATGGIHVSKMLAGQIDWLAAGVLYTKLDDENHGVFETWTKTKEYRTTTMGDTRFWMLKSMEHGHGHGAGEASEEPPKYVPVSLDVHDSGNAKHLVAEGTAFLTHTRTDAHGPVPGTGGNLAAISLSGFERSVTLGPAPEGVILESTWTH